VKKGGRESSKHVKKFNMGGERRKRARIRMRDQRFHRLEVRDNDPILI